MYRIIQTASASARQQDIDSGQLFHWHWSEILCCRPNEMQESISARAILTLCVTILFVTVGTSAEEAPDPTSQSTIEARQASSLGGALKVAGTTPVHVLYMHGIGATGSGDSIALQQSICRYARKLMGQECQGEPTRLGRREYAEDGIFARHNSPDSNGLSQKVAGERYMEAPIWSSWDECHASAPFVDHYRISFRSGKTLLVDELNWWRWPCPLSASS